jgi:peptide deformylase
VIRPILQYPDPRLRQVATPIAADEFGQQELLELVTDLFDTLWHHKAAGLAAVQIGVSKRVFVMALGGDEVTAVCNPMVLASDGETLDTEGCFSFAGGKLFERMRAPASAWCQWRNPDGAPCGHKFEGALARAFVHESAHLDGQTMLDRMGKAQRSLFLQRLMKHAKAGRRAKT